MRSIIDLGHSLGLRVVAEGVETRASLDRLRGLRLRPGAGLAPEPGRCRPTRSSMLARGPRGEPAAAAVAERSAAPLAVAGRASRMIGLARPRLVGARPARSAAAVPDVRDDHPRRGRPPGPAGPAGAVRRRARPLRRPARRDHRRRSPGSARSPPTTSRRPRTPLPLTNVHARRRGASGADPGARRSPARPPPSTAGSGCRGSWTRRREPRVTP